MIYGIGTDIVAVARMGANLERFGERFARRILAESEWSGFELSVKKANYLAKRFAAKEAAVKAMGTGFVDGMVLSQISVEHDRKGKPLLCFQDRAAEIHSVLGIGTAHLSLSDEDDYAVAFVTLMKLSPPQR